MDGWQEIIWNDRWFTIDGIFILAVDEVKIVQTTSLFLKELQEDGFRNFEGKKKKGIVQTTQPNF